MLPNENDQLTPLVARFMKIEDLSWGNPDKDYIIRYRGHLYNEDTAAAYDQIADLLRPREITPLFRTDEGRHAIILIKGVIKPKPSNPRINLLLFLITVISVMLAGVIYSYSPPATDSQFEMILDLFRNLKTGIPFAISLLAILLAHEFGHYLAARYHKTHVTLPYFLPFPLSPLGTMGAFIQIKEPPKNKRILLDIGLAGPLAGMVVALPVLFLGLYLSEVGRLPAHLLPNQFLSLEGNSILYLVMKYIVKGSWLPMPTSFQGLSPIMYWIRYFFTGSPIPYGGTDLIMHPIAWAGWAGLLVTALNLIPAGQLDGGHVMYVLLGKRAVKLVPWIIGALLLMGLVWAGWWFWAFLIFLLGRIYLEPLDQITPLDPRRRAIAIFGILLFLLVFMPVPLRDVTALVP